VPDQKTFARSVAENDDMDAIYMMGFDVWREALDIESYLRTCRESKKYQGGRWFVLEAEGRLVSSMIVYSGGFALPVNSLGFGSIATHPQSRGQGFGSSLISGVIELQICHAASAIYLHSDIAPAFYEGFGFLPLSESRPGAMCMVRPGSDAKPTCSPLPNYF
jgi:predicted N-acetyltransferase YhbS